MFFSIRLRKVCLFFACLFLFPLHAWDDDHYLSRGSICNNYLLYDDAIHFITHVIKQNPSNKEAYKERAISYFELNQLELALKDYKKAKEEKPDKNLTYPYFDWPTQNDFISLARLGYKDHHTTSASSTALDFATGLLQGTCQGSKEGTTEFLTSIRGSFNTLWAFACSPSEISRELIEAVSAMGEYLAYAKISDLLETVIPEFIECRCSWETWSDRVKGWKMGYILGKYGVGIFLDITMLRGLYIFNDLKRANIMAILERYSLTKSPIILAESAQYTAKNTHILKNNENVTRHILQKKHEWNRFIKITGDDKKDLNNVLKFLEKNKILEGERSLKWSDYAVHSYSYTKKIENETVVAIFDVNKNNAHLLKDAWIQTKPPHRP